MLPLLILAFIVVPVVELAIIIRVGQVLGLWPTIALLVVDSLVGAVLVKHEGRRAWQAFRSALQQGRWPGDEVTQGALVVFGGALLLTPGFLTDAVGVVSLLPPSRAALSRLIRRRLKGGRDRDRDRDRGGRDLDVEILRIDRDDRPDDKRWP